MPFDGLTSQPTVNHSFLARGIVTGRPRLAASEAKGRLGEAHRRIFLSRDGGSSRARRPERPGRKDQPITGFTYDNSEALTKTYDNNYWISTLNTVYSGTYVQELSFGEDNAGNLNSITDALAAGRDETYTVDALNRLHTASGAYGSRTYTYDNNSNRATRVAGATTYTSTMTTSTNLLGSYTDGTNTRHFTYSASGNMLTDDRTFVGGGALSNTFGGRDRLESMTVGTPTVTFKINALGQRVQKATTGATTDYHFDIFGHIIGEANDSTGANEIEYVWMEGQMLTQIDSSGNIFYVHNNQIGAPQKITNASRTLVWDYEIEPFGETYATPTSTTPTNHRFPGQYADSEDTLSYNLNRDYDASLGRYIQADPMGLEAGPNILGYAWQNPTQVVDPTGLAGTWVETPEGPIYFPIINPGTGSPNLWNPSGPVYITTPSVLTGVPVTINIGKAADLPHSEPANDNCHSDPANPETCLGDNSAYKQCNYICGDGTRGSIEYFKDHTCPPFVPKSELGSPLRGVPSKEPPAAD